MNGISKRDFVLSYDNKETYTLFKELNIISNKLDELIDNIGCELVVSGNRIPYIYEKVNYCLENCNDKIILNDLNVLFKKYCSLRNEIYKLNVDLIYIITQDFQDDYACYMEDIVQYACVCLVKIIERYDVNNNEEFSLYVYNTIPKMIIRELGNLAYSIKIPQRIVEFYYVSSKRYDKLCQRLGKEASVKEVADYMKRPIEKVGRMMAEASAFSSLDESTLMIDNNQLSFEGKRDELLLYLKRQLTAKQYFVLTKLYGLEDRVYSAHELSEILDVSSQQVYVLRKSALVRLRRSKNTILEVFKD